MKGNFPIVLTRFCSLLIILSFGSCKEKATHSIAFPFFLDEKCMIVNVEQDNTIEGNYFRVLKHLKEEAVIINLPDHFFVDESNCSNYMLGWGTNKPLYDAGVENLRKIKSIDAKSKTCVLGELLRGEGFPAIDQRVVFWNMNPSGLVKDRNEPVVKPEEVPDFHGKSVGFSAIVFDSLSSKWVMFINEVDTDFIQTYALVSDDMKNWSIGNNSEPIFKADDFKSTSWAGVDPSGKVSQAAIGSDLIRNNNTWYYFMHGYDKVGKRHIGVAISKQSVFGPYKIIPEPIISPGTDGGWNDLSCFNAKVLPYRDHFILFYDGKNMEGDERVGLAESNDLLNWTKYAGNPVVDEHDGWRSSSGSSEPCYVATRGDSIFLMLAGTKKFKMGPWHHYITRRMYLDKSGNVNDAELGVFLSVDGGKSFTPHANNPVFVNNYSDVFENDHMGGNFKLIKVDSMDYLFYQAKSSYEGARYNIMFRILKK